jgi:AbrB family looped-hinge helix DNA binding protein
VRVLSIQQMSRLTEGLPSKSEKIRRLGSAGYSRSQIADFLGVRYQFVRNVLVDAERRSGQRSSEATSEPVPQTDPPAARIKVGANGLIVLPDAIRSALAVKEGDTLVASVEGGELSLLTIPAAVRRAQAIVREVVPEGVSLVEDLLQDRRREVERDSGNG